MWVGKVFQAGQRRTCGAIAVASGGGAFSKGERRLGRADSDAAPASSPEPSLPRPPSLPRDSMMLEPYSDDMKPRDAGLSRLLFFFRLPPPKRRISDVPEPAGGPGLASVSKRDRGGPPTSPPPPPPLLPPPAPLLLKAEETEAAALDAARRKLARPSAPREAMKDPPPRLFWRRRGSHASPPSLSLSPSPANAAAASAALKLKGAVRKRLCLLGLVDWALDRNSYSRPGEGGSG